MTVVVNNFGKSEDVVIMQGSSRDEGRVQTNQGVAVVHQSLVVERGHRKSFLLISRQNPGNEKLEEEISSVYFPGIRVGAGVLW